MTLVTRTKAYERTTLTSVPANLADEVETQPTLSQGSGITNGTRALLQSAHRSRIRQGGTVRGVTLWRDDGATTNLTSIIFQVWHKDGATYDLVGESENFLTTFNTFSDNTVNTITFSTPITGVQEGDYTAMELVTGAGGSAAGLISAVSASGTNTLIVDSPGTTNVDFDAGSTSGNWMPFQVLMDNPVIGCIGTSHTAGHNIHDSYLEAGPDDDPTKAWPSKLGALYNISIQNLGIGAGGNLSSQGLDRFQRDIINIKPTICTIDYGTSDINNNIDVDSFSGNIDSMIRQCANNGIIPVVLSIPPRDDFTNEQHIERQERNQILKSLADNPPFSLFIDLETTLGQNRPTGPAGNLWDIQTSLKDPDGIHFLEAANTAIAAKIKSEFDTLLTEKIDVNASTVMNTSQRNAIVNPPEGLTFYDTDLDKRVFYNGTAWETVTSS